jgi:hypothetical protein
MGWGSLLDRITSWLPIQKPTERLKNELAKLQEERNLLLIQKADITKAKRMGVIERRIIELQRVLAIKAND